MRFSINRPRAPEEQTLATEPGKQNPEGNRPTETGAGPMGEAELGTQPAATALPCSDLEGGRAPQGVCESDLGGAGGCSRPIALAAAKGRGAVKQRPRHWKPSQDGKPARQPPDRQTLTETRRVSALLVRVGRFREEGRRGRQNVAWIKPGENVSKINENSTPETPYDAKPEDHEEDKCRSPG